MTEDAGLGLVFSEPTGPDGPLVVEQLPVLAPWEWDDSKCWQRWTSTNPSKVAATCTGGLWLRTVVDAGLRREGYRLL